MVSESTWVDTHTRYRSSAFRPGRLYRRTVSANGFPDESTTGDTPASPTTTAVKTAPVQPRQSRTFLHRAVVLSVSRFLASYPQSLRAETLATQNPCATGTHKHCDTAQKFDIIASVERQFRDRAGCHVWLGWVSISVCDSRPSSRNNFQPQQPPCSGDHQGNCTQVHQGHANN